MSRFYGEVTGSRGNTSSRCGHKNTGLSAHIRGWRIGARVRMFCADGDEDGVSLSLTSESGASTTDQSINTFYEGDRVESVDKLYCLVEDTGKVVRVLGVDTRPPTMYVPAKGLLDRLLRWLRSKLPTEHVIVVDLPGDDWYRIIREKGERN